MKKVTSKELRYLSIREAALSPGLLKLKSSLLSLGRQQSRGETGSQSWVAKIVGDSDNVKIRFTLTRDGHSFPKEVSIVEQGDKFFLPESLDWADNYNSGVILDTGTYTLEEILKAVKDADEDMG